MVTYILEDSAQLTAEQLKMLKEAEKRPVQYDEDCPQMTSEMLESFTRVQSSGKRISEEISFKLT